MKLVDVNMIRDGVIKTLKSQYPNMDIYGEEIQQGFQEPCFFVKLLNMSQNRELNRRFLRYHTFDIHYFPSDPKNRGAHTMAEALYSLFETLIVDGETYFITGANHDVIDGVLHFYMDVNFTVWQEATNDPKMQNLDQREWVK